MAELKLSKGLQGARDAGVGVAAASLAASILCSIFPETAEGPGLDYATTFTACLIMAGGTSRAFFNWLKHRKRERRGGAVILTLAFSLAVGATGCATSASPRDVETSLVTVGEDLAPGKKVALNVDGTVVVDSAGEPVFEDKDTFEIVYTKQGHNDSANEHWGNNLLDVSTAALAATASILAEPWVGMSLLLANGVTNGLMLPAMLDIDTPEYAVVSTVKVRVTGDHIVAAGGKSQGHDVKAPKTDLVATDLSDGPDCWFVIFDASIPVDTLRVFTNCGEAEAPATETDDGS